MGRYHWKKIHAFRYSKKKKKEKLSSELSSFRAWWRGRHGVGPAAAVRHRPDQDLVEARARVRARLGAADLFHDGGIRARRQQVGQTHVGFGLQQ